MLARLSCLAFCAGFVASAWALAPEEAIQITQNQACKGALNVAQALEQTLKSHSQRDLGWRVFPGDGHIDVERAVLVNKGMELRYRWRVEAQGRVGPENERAERLCGED
jgi:hypothetical protein